MFKSKSMHANRILHYSLKHNDMKEKIVEMPIQQNRAENGWGEERNYIFVLAKTLSETTTLLDTFSR